MSHSLINRSPDLSKLVDHGHQVGIQNGHLVITGIPYLTPTSQLAWGALISPLELAGEKTRKPNDHTVYFQGQFPSDGSGNQIREVAVAGQAANLGHGLAVDFKFSCKPSGGYEDYYHKMTTYLSYIMRPAQRMFPGVSARAGQGRESRGSGPFNYTETASGRAGTGSLNALLENEVAAIIGTGGTGSYILDLVAKTPVREIRLFDGDEFLQHNAFRAPGAASLHELEQIPTKVEYLTSIYSKMRTGITPYPHALTEENLHLLDGVSFAFLSMDGGGAKKVIVAKLEALGVPFIDVGMGLELTDGSLGGVVRLTTSTPDSRGHLHPYLASTSDGEKLYASNIQIAELNALNAALAVIKWKKLRGFYRDLEREIHSLYTTDGNHIDNSEAK